MISVPPSSAGALFCAAADGDDAHSRNGMARVKVDWAWPRKRPGNGGREGPSAYGATSLNVLDGHIKIDIEGNAPTNGTS